MFYDGTAVPFVVHTRLLASNPGSPGFEAINPATHAGRSHDQCPFRGWDKYPFRGGWDMSLFIAPALRRPASGYLVSLKYYEDFFVHFSIGDSNRYLLQRYDITIANIINRPTKLYKLEKGVLDLSQPDGKGLIGS